MQNYGSRYTSLKTDFCAHLGSQTKVPSCFTLWSGSSSHTSNLVSSPGCDSVMLCAHPGILLIGISTRGQFSLPAGRKRQKVITDFIEGCSKRSFYDRFPFFSYEATIRLLTVFRTIAAPGPSSDVTYTDMRLQRQDSNR